MLDRLVEGATVVDGSGGAPVVADVGIAGGRIVEVGTRREIFENPCEDYTKALMAAVPIPDPTVYRKAGQPGL